MSAKCNHNNTGKKLTGFSFKSTLDKDFIATKFSCISSKFLILLFKEMSGLYRVGTKNTNPGLTAQQ